jgi:hypothetical protein
MTLSKKNKKGRKNKPKTLEKRWSNKKDGILKKRYKGKNRTMLYNELSVITRKISITVGW